MNRRGDEHAVAAGLESLLHIVGSTYSAAGNEFDAGERCTHLSAEIERGNSAPDADGGEVEHDERRYAERDDALYNLQWMNLSPCFDVRDRIAVFSGRD